VAEIDFYLGAGDTAPVLEMICKDPAGVPVDLTGATVSFQLRPENEETARVELPADVVVPGTNGRIRFNWTGYTPGRYEGRVKALLASGKRMSFPNFRQLKIEVTEDP
jgi:hypothetical protein